MTNTDNPLIRELTKELQKQAPDFVKRIFIQRDESSPGFLLTLEVLFSERMSYEEVVRDPRQAAARFFFNLRRDLETFNERRYNTSPPSP